MAGTDAPDPSEIAVRGLQLRGLDYIHAISAGELPAPPISTLMGFRGVSAESGRAVFEMEPGPQHYNPIGSVHGGVALTLLDSAMGVVIHRGSRVATAEGRLTDAAGKLLPHGTTTCLILA